MLVVFDNRIGQLLPGEVLLGHLLIILILRPVQGHPELVEHSLLLGQAVGLGVRCGLWSWNDPSLILELSPLDSSSSCRTYPDVGTG